MKKKGGRFFREPSEEGILSEVMLDRMAKVFGSGEDVLGVNQVGVGEGGGEFDGFAEFGDIAVLESTGDEGVLGGFGEI